MVDSTNLPEVDINQIATDLNGKMDRDGVNATASVCIESYHDENGNWYREYSDGWCEQGGKISPTNAQAIDLLKPYKDTNYSVLAVNCYKDTSNRRWASAGINSSSQIWVMASTSSSGASSTLCMWEAKGYIR